MFGYWAAPVDHLRLLKSFMPQLILRDRQTGGRVNKLSSFFKPDYFGFDWKSWFVAWVGGGDRKRWKRISAGFELGKFSKSHFELSRLLRINSSTEFVKLGLTSMCLFLKSGFCNCNSALPTKTTFLSSLHFLCSSNNVSCDEIIDKWDWKDYLVRPPCFGRFTHWNTCCEQMHHQAEPIYEAMGYIKTNYTFTYMLVCTMMIDK